MNVGATQFHPWEYIGFLVQCRSKRKWYNTKTFITPPPLSFFGGQLAWKPTCWGANVINEKSDASAVTQVFWEV
jgi:hypothetical protein